MKLPSGPGAPIRHLRNPRRRPDADYPAELAAILGPPEFDRAAAEIATWPGYAPTSLLSLDGVAAELGIGRLLYKDESGRFGLGSFKALGGAYAVLRILQQAVRERTGATPSAADLAAGGHREIASAITVTTATDGNHGRSVAWGAQLFGCRAVIVIHEHVSEGRAAAIASYAAEVVRVAGHYDDSVRYAAEQARARGWTVVSDTSWPGYRDIPRDVMAGYGLIMREIAAQIGSEPPTHLLVHAGVGALAAAVCAGAWAHWRERRPRFVTVEPHAADCIYRSIAAGLPTPAEGALDTIMAGLACGEVSPLAWPILDAGSDDIVTIEDWWPVAAVRRLARDGVVAGETGVAGVAALMAAAETGVTFEALGLGPDARVLVIGSEGATDAEVYRNILLAA